MKRLCVVVVAGLIGCWTGVGAGLSDMLALTTVRTNMTVMLPFRDAEGDGGGGLFRVITDDGRATNNGTVFRSTVNTNLLFVRQFAGPMNVRWFGLSPTFSETDPDILTFAQLKLADGQWITGTMLATVVVTNATAVQQRSAMIRFNGIRDGTNATVESSILENGLSNVTDLRLGWNVLDGSTIDGDLLVIFDVDVATSLTPPITVTISYEFTELTSNKPVIPFL